MDLQIEGAFPNDGIPVVPWDLNNDGIVDEVDENGNAIIPLAYPSHYSTVIFRTHFFMKVISDSLTTTIGWLLSGRIVKKWQ